MDNLDIHKSMNVRVYYKHVKKYPIISLSMENPRHFHRTILRTIPWDPDECLYAIISMYVSMCMQTHI